MAKSSNWVGVAGAVEHLDLNWFEYVPDYRTPAGTGTGLSFASWGWLASFKCFLTWVNALPHNTKELMLFCPKRTT
jgi:hypothetical protein